MPARVVDASGVVTEMANDTAGRLLESSPPQPQPRLRRQGNSGRSMAAVDA
jgi:hypothetical protein